MFLLSLVLAYFVSSVVASCPSGWVTYGGSCYLFSHGVNTWPDSMVVCEAFKASLVEVQTSTENNFLKNNLNGGANWIGANDIENEGEWKWMASRTRVTYTHWASSEPNNYHGENCATTSHTGWWYDYSCDVSHNFICEKPNPQGGDVVG